jgi:hypothetical protein
LTTVREAAFELFREHGMTTIFGNPGSAEPWILGSLPGDFRYVPGHERVGRHGGWLRAGAQAVRARQVVTDGGAQTAVFDVPGHRWLSLKDALRHPATAAAGLACSSRSHLLPRTS